MASPLIRRVEGIVGEVENRIDKPAGLLRSLLKSGVQTPKQIVAAGEFHPLLSCLDRAAAIGAELASRGFEVKLVSERVYRKGRTVGLHFHLEGERGGEKFRVFPAAAATWVRQGWLGEERMGDGREGRSDSVYRRIMARPVPAGADVSAFRLAGLSGRMDFLRQGGVSPVRLLLTLKGSGRAAKRVLRARELRERRRARGS